MENMENIRKLVCKKIDKIGDQPQISSGDLEDIWHGMSALKNSYKVEEYEQAAQYSRREGSYRSYDMGGNSNRRSYDGDGYAQGYSERRQRNPNGRFMSAYGDYEAADDVTQRLHEMMDQPGIDGEARRAIKKVLEHLER